MTTTAELRDRYGCCDEDVSRWVRAGYLHPVEGGGSGNPFTFDQLDVALVAVLVAWREATQRGSTTATVVRAARKQLRTHLKTGESTATVLVDVTLARGVHALIEVDR